MENLLQLDTNILLSEYDKSVPIHGHVLSYCIRKFLSGGNPQPSSGVSNRPSLLEPGKSINTFGC